MPALPQKALGENSLHAFLLASGGSRHYLAYGHITPISASIFTLPPSPLAVCLLLCVSYKTFVIVVKAYPDNPE